MTETIPENFFRVSVKALVVREGKILLCEEKDGRWELPGGGLDFEESPKDGVTREVKEELGVNVILVQKSPTYVWTQKYKEGVYLCFLGYRVEVDSLEFVPSDECISLKFFQQKDLDALNLHDNIKELPNLFDPSDFPK